MIVNEAIVIASLQFSYVSTENIRDKLQLVQNSAVKRQTGTNRRSHFRSLMVKLFLPCQPQTPPTERYSHFQEQDIKNIYGLTLLCLHVLDFRQLKTFLMKQVFPEELIFILLIVFSFRF